MTELITGLGWIGILSFCLGLYKMTNGKLSQKVNRPECHTAQEGVHQRVEDLSKHIDQRLDDLKEEVRRNGNAGRN